MCAGATRAAISSFTPGSQRVGLGVKTGCYISARSFAAIQFSRSQAPRLSAELSGEPPNLREPLKRPPLGGPQALPRLWGGYSLVPLLGCQKVPLHQLEEYITQGPDVNHPDPNFRRHIPRFSSRPRDNKSLASRRDLPLQVRRTFGSARRR